MPHRLGAQLAPQGLPACLGVRVWGLGFRLSGLGFRVYVGFRLQGLGFM